MLLKMCQYTLSIVNTRQHNTFFTALGHGRHWILTRPRAHGQLGRTGGTRNGSGTATFIYIHMFKRKLYDRKARGLRDKN